MPNDPYLDDSVQWRIRSGNVAFHEPAYREVADAILDAGLATEVVHRIGSGKEADVYLCRDGSRMIAVKTYRLYRTSHRGGRPIKLETMGQAASREFELLVYAWRNGARVPEPRRRIENMFSMEYLGSNTAPAPMLRHSELEEPEPFLAETLRTIEKLADAGIVHADLSPFNILVHRELPWIIDLAACFRVDRLGMSPWVRLTDAAMALRHGLRAIAQYFRRYGLPIQTDEFEHQLIEKLDRFGVLA